MASPLPLTRSPDGSWQLDCLGMLCPVPVIKTGRAIREVGVGDVLVVLADDPGAELDLVDWCGANRQEHLGSEQRPDRWITRIRRSR